MDSAELPCPSHATPQEIQEQQINEVLGIAIAHYHAGRLHDAIKVYQAALTQGIAHPNIYGNLGAHLQDIGDWNAAEKAYRQALDLAPQHTATLYNLGCLLALQHKTTAAETSLRQAIALNPDYTSAYIALGNLLGQNGCLDEAMVYLNQACELEPDSPTPLGAKLFNLAYDPHTKASDMHHVASLMVQRLPIANAPEVAWNLVLQNAGQINIKVGFISGDFKDHPVGYFLENLLRHANREHFEWHIFSNFESTDDVALRLKTLATSWTSIANQSDSAAHAVICAQGIDVLFDLSGHTALHRLSLFAMRAAPVQISWLGWHDTTGLAQMDYLMTDEASLPPVRREDGRLFISEIALLLPRTRLCMMPPLNCPPVAPLPMLKNGHITFGSVQILAKISNQCLEMWKRILEQAPKARLLIRAKQFLISDAIAPFAQKLAEHGLPMERITLAHPLGREDYLASYAEIDVLLDSHPYPGGTTTAEALWMGVPTITLGGNTMISRQGVSLLTAAGLADWVTHSPEDYINKAIYWSQNADLLADLRNHLRLQAAQTPLFDGAQFAQDFEATLRHALAHKKHNNGLTHVV